MLITRLNFWTLFSSRSPCLMVDWGERGVKRERGRYIHTVREREGGTYSKREGGRYIQQEREREVYTYSKRERGRYIQQEREREVHTAREREGGIYSKRGALLHTPGIGSFCCQAGW